MFKKEATLENWQNLKQGKKVEFNMRKVNPFPP